MKCGRREMKSFHDFVPARGGRPWFPAIRRSGRANLARWGGKLRLRSCRGVLFPVALLAICLGLGLMAHGQSAPSADAGGIRLSAGGTVSGYNLGYGDVKVLGASAFVDVDTLRHLDSKARRAGSSFTGRSATRARAPMRTPPPTWPGRATPGITGDSSLM
jgi:hypothetical protein